MSLGKSIERMPRRRLGLKTLNDVSGHREGDLALVAVAESIQTNGEGSAEEILASGDRALYEAKQNGRDRVAVAAPIQGAASRLSVARR